MTDVPSRQQTYHAQRDRAESFGAVAAAYDRFRPDYPAELVDSLVALHPETVLDVGCGTGKAARQLMARGLDVLGVELDAGMAAVARGHGVPVEVASFEKWDDRGRTFDLIVSGQAWHWVDPGVGAPKLVRLLRPGGAVCLFWNYDNFGKEIAAAIEGVYRRLVPHLIETGRAGEDVTHERTLRETGCFSSVQTRDFPWTESLPIDDWIARASTYSTMLLLGEPLLAQVQDGLREALRPFGPELVLKVGTHALWARP